LPASHHPAPISTAPPTLSAPPAHAAPSDWSEPSSLFEQLAAVDGMPPPQKVQDAPEAPDLTGDVGVLFSSYRAYVAKIGRRILGPSSEVDDLIQDVFLATLRDIHKLEDPTRLAAWLGTITTRMARRRRFKISIHPPALEDPDVALDRIIEEGPSPESTADLAGSVERLLGLPDELRTPWLLKHVEGHTLEDVAKRCDCSLSTAQRRIQTASGRIHRPRR